MMVRSSAKLESIVGVLTVLTALTGLLYVFRVFGNCLKYQHSVQQEWVEAQMTKLYADVCVPVFRHCPTYLIGLAMNRIQLLRPTLSKFLTSLSNYKER
ncbi:hypothetical protein E4K67_28820 [Desulfosporosinus fructosivorans]|uniref:Uncharacterized protein n=1 Tax=Desulfosporosinus fructosivorans TaxID=2018669 RepID=A0A4Z0QW92_9FIRM|nr:hypothetical protein [Desulfosporosinus fructosivorans]TGE34784.1 hypothetical protein E4K67_28820 [Desulfosporosinus fructosivorans]